MENLTGQDNFERYQAHSTQFRQEPEQVNTSLLTENIISNSVDFKDWINHIQLPNQQAPTSEKIQNSTSLLDHGLQDQPLSFPILVKRVFRKIKGDKYVEIPGILTICHEYRNLFWGGWVDLPRLNSEYHSCMIPIGGWVLGKQSYAVSVQVTFEDKLLAEIPVNFPRPDVDKLYSYLPEKFPPTGFHTEVDFTVLPGKGIIKLYATLKNGDIGPLGLLRFVKY